MRAKKSSRIPKCTRGNTTEIVWEPVKPVPGNRGWPLSRSSVRPSDAPVIVPVHLYTKMPPSWATHAMRCGWLTYAARNHEKNIPARSIAAPTIAMYLAHRDRTLGSRKAMCAADGLAAHTGYLDSKFCDGEAGRVFGVGAPAVWHAPSVVRCRHEPAPANPRCAPVGWNSSRDPVGDGMDRVALVDGSHRMERTHGSIALQRESHDRQ